MDVQLIGITTYRSLRTALQRYVSKVEIASSTC